jgi:hypothetical protein
MPKDTTIQPVAALASTDGSPALDPSNPILARSVQLTPENNPKRVQKVEPQFRAICRILNWDPREVLPEELCDAVDAVYQFGIQNPDTFQTTPFDTAEEKNDALVLMRAYAETPGEHGYTIYTKTDVNPAMLIWKVTKRRGSRPPVDLSAVDNGSAS